jgi:hypothetical protein
MGGVKVFQTMNPMLWSSLIAMLKPLRFDPGETVCRQGDECTEMCLVYHGKLHGSTQVPADGGTRTREIEVGDSFNVLCLLKVREHNVQGCAQLFLGRCSSFFISKFRKVFLREHRFVFINLRLHTNV